MTRSKVLVTGGAGYVGSHACKALHLAGYIPVCFDSLARGHRDAVRWGPLEQGDLLDRDRLDQVLAVHRPDCVMHFAALTYVGESVRDPLSYYRVNVGGTVNLLRAMQRHSVNRLVFSSSCAVYGTPATVPIAESAPRRPVSPYGWSKYMVESILSDTSAVSELRYVSLRYFNAAGADPDGEIGECHDPETHLIPLVLKTATGRMESIEIYGDDYDTGDGTCIRDYVHVRDLADAHVRALRRLEQGGQSAVYNVGTSTGISVKEIISRAAELTGRPVATAVGPRRPGDPPRLVADASLINKELGWSAQCSDLDNILSSAWKWERDRG